MTKKINSRLDYYAQEELRFIAGRIPDLAEALLSEKDLDGATLDEAIKDFYDFYDAFIEKYLKEKEKGGEKDEDKE